MTKRPFGSTGLSFNPVAFGAMRIQPNAKGISGILLHALERGIDFNHSGSLATGGNRETLAGDVKLSNASPEFVTEYLNRIARLRDDLCDETTDLNELSIRFALSKLGVSALALSLSSNDRVNRALEAAAKGPLPDDVFKRICREHVWVKNFYYLSKSTVDGNPNN